MKDWFYNEADQVGVDYADAQEAAVYDERMEQFRDYKAEALEFIHKLQLPCPERAVAVDIGCGTGAFAIHAAAHFGAVHAVDVSPKMLAIAQRKAQQQMIANIEFHQAGFLEFMPPKQVDVINTKWALHHLPDYWKQVALVRMNQMLKTGGLLFLTDWVFTFAQDYEAAMEALIDDMSRDYSEHFVREAKGHIREEFSTFDWILEGMITRAGFSIESINRKAPIETVYLCKKR